MHITYRNVLLAGVAATVVAALALTGHGGDDLATPASAPSQQRATDQPASHRQAHLDATAVKATAAASALPTVHSRANATPAVDEDQWRQSAQDLQTRLLTAWMSGDAQTIAQATQHARQFAQRHAAGAAPSAR